MNRAILSSLALHRRKSHTGLELYEVEEIKFLFMGESSLQGSLFD